MARPTANPNERSHELAVSTGRMQMAKCVPLQEPNSIQSLLRAWRACAICLFSAPSIWSLFQSKLSFCHVSRREYALANISAGAERN